MKTRMTGSFILLCVLAAPYAMAQDAARAIAEAAIDASFSEAERQIITKYFGDRHVVVESDRDYDKDKKSKGGKGMPPGLAKRDSLPPGLAKLERNGSLPPGLGKKNLPNDLSRQLSPVPEGYERQIVEDAAIVLVHKATGRIADVIKDAMLD